MDQKLKIFYIFMCLTVFSINRSHASFIQTGGSARLKGMGDVSVSATGVDAIFANPAGILRVRSLEAGFAYSPLYTGLNIQKNSFGLVLPFSSLNIGLGWLNFDADIYSENTFIFTGAWKPVPQMYVGVKYRFLIQKIMLTEAVSEGIDENLTGHCIDIGIIYKIKEFLHFGINADSLLSSNLAREGTEYAERIFTAGVSYRYMPAGISFVRYLTFAGELSYHSEQEDRLVPKIGLESVSGSEKLSLILRTGYGRNVISLGPGILFYGITVDYAYLYNIKIEDIGTSHVMSVKYNAF
ncbi:MAG: hypothetical protein KKH98_07905 [Spirochaetes bacterium]|nr:hypothetical protein [Spirochaetota bacterium]